MHSNILSVAAAASLGLAGVALLARRVLRRERGPLYDVAVCLLGAAAVFDMPGPGWVAAVWTASFAAATIFRSLRRSPR